MSKTKRTAPLGAVPPLSAHHATLTPPKPAAKSSGKWVPPHAGRAGPGSRGR
jgi:hypothetical protein